MYILAYNAHKLAHTHTHAHTHMDTLVWRTRLDLCCVPNGGEPAARRRNKNTTNKRHTGHLSCGPAIAMDASRERALMHRENM